jgi:hypothetical protein
MITTPAGNALTTGTVTFAGQSWPYRDGILPIAGRVLRVSKDDDFVVDELNAPVGAIINGVLTLMDSLTADQQDFYKQKYGF